MEKVESISLGDDFFENKDYWKKFNYDGTQMFTPSGCTGCGGYGEHKNFELIKEGKIKDTIYF